MRADLQIPVELFCQMVSYIMDHEDNSDSRYRAIMTGVYRKAEAMRRHDLYTTYKSSQIPAEKEQARQHYLDAVGMRASYRWEGSISTNDEDL